jgi:hypothetical protein
MSGEILFDLLGVFIDILNLAEQFTIAAPIRVQLVLAFFPIS